MDTNEYLLTPTNFDIAWKISGIQQSESDQIERYLNISLMRVEWEFNYDNERKETHPNRS